MGTLFTWRRLGWVASGGDADGEGGGAGGGGTPREFARERAGRGAVEVSGVGGGGLPPAV